MSSCVFALFCSFILILLLVAIASLDREITLTRQHADGGGDDLMKPHKLENRESCIHKHEQTAHWERVCLARLNQLDHVHPEKIAAVGP